MELRGETGLGVAVRFLVPEKIVAAEREEPDGVLGTEPPRRARLVVPVLEDGIRSGERDERGGIRVSPGDEHRALPVGERSLDERAGVEEAHVAFAVDLVGGPPRLAGEDAAREPPVACRIAARVEVDALDEAGVDDARPGANVVEQRNADAVDVVAVVAGRRAAHEEERQPADERRDAGQGLHDAEGIAECARHLAHLLPAERGLPGFPAALPVDLDLFGGSGSRSRSRSRSGSSVRGRRLCEGPRRQEESGDEERAGERAAHLPARHSSCIVLRRFSSVRTSTAVRASALAASYAVRRPRSLPAA
jgi:hypothetical protein